MRTKNEGTSSDQPEDGKIRSNESRSVKNFLREKSEKSSSAKNDIMCITDEELSHMKKSVSGAINAVEYIFQKKMSKYNYSLIKDVIDDWKKRLGEDDHSIQNNYLSEAAVQQETEQIKSEAAVEKIDAFNIKKVKIYTDEKTENNQLSDNNKHIAIECVKCKEDHLQNEWGETNQKIVNILEEWNKARANTNFDKLMEKEVYRHLSEDKRRHYEKKQGEYKKLEEDYGISLKQASDLENAIDGLKTLYEDMSKILEFEQNVYDLTGMTSERLSKRLVKHKNSDKENIKKLKQKITDAAGRIGWKNVMKKATEVIQQVNDWNCRYIIEAVGEQGDESIVEDLVKILPNEQIEPNIRLEVNKAIYNLKFRSIPIDGSIARDLIEIVPNEQIHRSVRQEIVDMLGFINDRSITERLTEICNNNQIDQGIRKEIERIGKCPTK